MRPRLLCALYWVQRAIPGNGARALPFAWLPTPHLSQQARHHCLQVLRAAAGLCRRRGIRRQLGRDGDHVPACQVLHQPRVGHQGVARRRGIQLRGALTLALIRQQQGHGQDHDRLEHERLIVANIFGHAQRFIEVLLRLGEVA